MLTVTVATASNQSRALQLLFSRFPIDEQLPRVQDALAAAERGSLSLEGLLLATESELPLGAALVMLQRDATALVWPPVLSCGSQNQIRTEDALMQEVCRRIDAAGIRRSQSLLIPDDHVEETLLTRHGFAYGADVFFLARVFNRLDSEINRVAPRENTGLAQHSVNKQCFGEVNRTRFANVIEESYRNSLDCPHLKNFRDGADAIESHKLSGQFDPENWWIYSINGRDAGVLLLNGHPDQNSVELVYFGVVPEMRGMGLGKTMLRQGIQLASHRNYSAMFLAVDSENHYANSIYSEFGFAELARRRVMIRISKDLARQ
jgi:ribosomal protein S18 acetylase RimI-like enzyme